MKKLLAIVLLFCMIFACSCSSSKGKGDTTTGDPTVSTSEAPADSSSEDTVDSSSETPDAPTEFSRGTVEGNVYDNAYADITFTKSDAWTYLTDVELAQLIGIALEQLNAKNPFDGVSSLFDMMAVDTQTNSNVSVSFEKTTVTESAYLDLVKSQLSSRRKNIAFDRHIGIREHIGYDACDRCFNGTVYPGSGFSPFYTFSFKYR